MPNPLSVVSRIGERLYGHSPKDNLGILRRKLSPGREAANTLQSSLESDHGAVEEYLCWKAQQLSQSVIVLGHGNEADTMTKVLERAGKRRVSPNGAVSSGSEAADFTVLKGANPRDDVVVCSWAASPEAWNDLAQTRRAIPNRIFTFQELLLPMSLVQASRKSLDYRLKPLDKIMQYYTGADFFGPIQELNAAFQIKGKRVIELGPMDGYQTAALVNLGAKSVTCIEARAENAIKTLAAKQAFGWTNVELIIDDFHNLSKANYGTFDLVFAHGVYYHSFAPFVFFENLFSLSDHIFLGGYIATDSFPAGQYVSLSHNGATYRAKESADGFGFTGGINLKAYYFTEEALLRLFTEQGYKIVPISPEESFQATGAYRRFLAGKD